MISGIGTDIIEIERVKNALKRPRFSERVYTTAEIAYAKERGQQGAASLAARWAAKEAILKALGTGLIGNMSLTDMEILPGEGGKPIARVSGEVAKKMEEFGIKNIHISLSHSRDYAIADCILEGADSDNES